MASISLQVGGEVSFCKYEREFGDVISVDLKYDIPGEPVIPFARDTIYFHGTEAQLSNFATKMLAALPETDIQRCVRETQECGGTNWGKANLPPMDFYHTDITRANAEDGESPATSSLGPYTTLELDPQALCKPSQNGHFMEVGTFVEPAHIVAAMEATEEL